MKKIYFLIPFLIWGCSTPEIHIPSYNFGNDANSTDSENKAEKATSEVASIEDSEEVENTNQTNIIETTDKQEVLPNTELEKDTKDVEIPEVSETEELDKEAGDDMSVNTVEPKPKKVTKKTTSSGFFSSLFKPKPKVKSEYYTGGKIRSKLVMSDDTGESGLLYRYGYEGKVTSTVHLKNGIKNGLETLFNKKGRVVKRTPYVNGKKDGIVEVYYPDGKVLAQITYVDNKRHGRASKYNHDGTTNEEVYYEHGRVSRTEDDDIEIPMID